jgi:hypothetical protein
MSDPAGRGALGAPRFAGLLLDPREMGAPRLAFPVVCELGRLILILEVSSADGSSRGLFDAGGEMSRNKKRVWLSDRSAPNSAKCGSEAGVSSSCAGPAMNSGSGRGPSSSGDAGVSRWVAIMNLLVCPLTLLALS